MAALLQTLAQYAFSFLCMIIYGTGYIAGSSGRVMIVDAINGFDDKYGGRNDGTKE